MKKNTNLQKSIKQHYGELGITIMALATMIGIVELPEHTSKPATVVLQPSRYSIYNQKNEDNNPLLREKEENSSEYVSYSEAERTPSRSGRY